MADDYSYRIPTDTHQRLVKTTPNPRATKKSNEDELELPLELPPLPLPLPELLPPLTRVLVSVGEAEDVVGLELDRLGVVVVDATDTRAVSAACLIAIRAPSTTAGLMNVMLPGTNLAR